jgi:hypothetical protein
LRLPLCVLSRYTPFASLDMSFDAMAFGPTALPKMMLGFVVRRCTVDMGHQPSPEEFAVWANNYKERNRTYRLFGRPITVNEARVILRHRSRIVTARSAAPHECVVLEDHAANGNGSATVLSFSTAMARLKARAK